MSTTTTKPRRDFSREIEFRLWLEPPENVKYSVEAVVDIGYRVRPEGPGHGVLCEWWVQSVSEVVLWAGRWGHKIDRDESLYPWYGDAIEAALTMDATITEKCLGHYERRGD